MIILWDATKFSRLKTIQLPGSVEALISTSPTDLYLALSPSDIRYFNLEIQQLSKKSMLSLGSDETVISFHSLNHNHSHPNYGFWISTLSSSVYHVGKKVDGDKKNPALQINKQVNINKE